MDSRASDHPSPEFVPPAGFLAKAPLSSAVRLGDLVLISGQVGIDEQGRVVPGIGEQTRGCLESIASILQGLGGSLRDVVQTRVFLTNFAEYEDYNRVYRDFFSDPFPTRSTVGTPMLALGAEIEIEAIAILSQDR